MKSNRGYISIDLGALFAWLLLVGALLGAVGWSLILWIWPFFKAWLHQLTA